MTLVVEDGTIVENADSYNTEAEVVAHAAIYGVTMTTGEAETYVKRGRSYLDTQIYQGEQVDFGVQSLPFPRRYVVIEGNLLDEEVIPTMLKKAECELAVMLFNGKDPQVIVTKEDSVKTKKFDVFEKTYMDNANTTPVYPRLSAYLDPLLESGGGGLNFRLGRSYG